VSAAGWWRGRLVGRATTSDLIALLSIVLLGAATIAAGRRASAVLRPGSAVELSRFVDRLDAPTRLPNAPVADLSDRTTTRALFDEIEKPYAVLSFYAPWCAPCQKEVPELIEKLGAHADVLIIVSADEDLEHTRRQLANLDLLEHGALVDVSGALFRDGRVRALPTTFVVNRQGAVRLRSRGYSNLDLSRMRSLVAPGAARGEDDP